MTEKQYPKEKLEKVIGSMLKLKELRHEMETTQEKMVVAFSRQYVKRLAEEGGEHARIWSKVEARLNDVTLRDRWTNLWNPERCKGFLKLSAHFTYGDSKPLTDADVEVVLAHVTKFLETANAKDDASEIDQAQESQVEVVEQLFAVAKKQAMNLVEELIQKVQFKIENTAPFAVVSVKALSGSWAAENQVEQAQWFYIQDTLKRGQEQEKPMEAISSIKAILKDGVFQKDGKSYTLIDTISYELAAWFSAPKENVSAIHKRRGPK
jgi:hypothetical protein